MVATVSGISFALEEISKSKNESPRKIRIVHVDHSWDDNSGVISGVLNFFNSADKQEINIRNQFRPTNTGPLSDHSDDLVKEHGTACAAILQTNSSIKLSDREKSVWNLAPLSSVFALPLVLPQDPYEKTKASSLFRAAYGAVPFQNQQIQDEWEEFETCWEKGFSTSRYRSVTESHEVFLACVKDFIDYQNSKMSLNTTFDRLIELCENGSLESGDIIVCPMSVKTYECCPKTAKAKRFDFPVVQFSSVRKKISTITAKHGVSVIISAGNSGIDLSYDELPLFFGTNPKKEMYRSRGLACGAVLVGADMKHSQRAEDRQVNTGKCIDASGRYMLDNVNLFKNAQLRQLAIHWRYSSGAAMVIAACLGTMQHYRLQHGYDPLKPYEARAHLRQWTVLPTRRAQSIVNSRGFMGNPPDLRAWMLGTAII